MAAGGLAGARAITLLVEAVDQGGPRRCARAGARSRARACADLRRNRGARWRPRGDSLDLRTGMQRPSRPAPLSAPAAFQMALRLTPSERARELLAGKWKRPSHSAANTSAVSGGRVARRGVCRSAGTRHVNPAGGRDPKSHRRRGAATRWPALMRAMLAPVGVHDSQGGEDAEGQERRLAAGPLQTAIATRGGADGGPASRRAPRSQRARPPRNQMKLMGIRSHGLDAEARCRRASRLPLAAPEPVPQRVDMSQYHGEARNTVTHQGVQGGRHRRNTRQERGGDPARRDPAPSPDRSPAPRNAILLPWGFAARWWRLHCRCRGARNVDPRPHRRPRSRLPTIEPRR